MLQKTPDKDRVRFDLVFCKRATTWLRLYEGRHESASRRMTNAVVVMSESFSTDTVILDADMCGTVRAGDAQLGIGHHVLTMYSRLLRGKLTFLYLVQEDEVDDLRIPF